jgi:hypothetical protein
MRSSLEFFKKFHAFHLTSNFNSVCILLFGRFCLRLFPPQNIPRHCGNCSPEGNDSEHCSRHAFGTYIGLLPRGIGRCRLTDDSNNLLNINDYWVCGNCVTEQPGTYAVSSSTTSTRSSIRSAEMSVICQTQADRGNASRLRICRATEPTETRSTFIWTQ